MSLTYDYIIVGAGTAGSILAARLCEDPGTTVLLLEAGSVDRSWTIQMPAAFARNFQGGPYNWSYWSTPQPNLANRRIYQPRGKVLGGSSSINAMVFLRGHALDYERWANEEGAQGWSYAEVLPYFRRSETYLGASSAYRGKEGPIVVRQGTVENPVVSAFLEAGSEAGHPYTPDVNGYQQEGFGPWDMNVDAGVRASTAHAYLRRDGQPAGLIVQTEILVQKIVIEQTRATAVQYVLHGQLHTATAEREILLCAGAFGSPQLLMLSGIGPADHLRGHGIDVVVDSQGVGSNLQDHLYAMIQYESTKPVCLARYLQPHRMALLGAQWLTTRRGPGSTNHVEVGAFLRSRPDIAHPDVQVHFKPILLDGWQPSRTHGFNLGGGTLRALSRGTVRLSSADPQAVPLIDPNYLAEHQDIIDMRNGVKLMREIVCQPAFDPFRGREHHLSADARTDDEIDRFIRENASSGYHPCGTCRMGSDSGAVCDPMLRVRGVDGLRVVDASVMPSETSSNLNAPTVMIAERAADLIRGVELLPRAHLSYVVTADGELDHRSRSTWNPPYAVAP